MAGGASFASGLAHRGINSEYGENVPLNLMLVLIAEGFAIFGLFASVFVRV